LYEEKTIIQIIDSALVEPTYGLRYPENLTEDKYYDGTQMVDAGLTGSEFISGEVMTSCEAYI